MEKNMATELTGEHVQTTEDQLESLPEYNWIDWRKPWPITVGVGKTAFGCRFCAAIQGFSQRLSMPQTAEEFVNHMLEVHRRKAAL
jgi:flavodoxin